MNIFRIAETRMNWDALIAGLREVNVDGEKWIESRKGEYPDAEVLIENAAKACYRSWDTDSNPNLTMVRDNTPDSIKNLLKQKHGSVFEHAYVSYFVTGVDRVLTHELVRHRHCNFSQESQRFVRIEVGRYYNPACFNKDKLMQQFYELVKREPKLELKFNTLEGMYNGTMQRMEMLYTSFVNSVVDILDLDNRDFGFKKYFTSGFRRLLTQNTQTCILVTANHRSWREMIEKRTAQRAIGEGAEEAIRELFFLIFQDLRDSFRNIYGDAELTENYEDKRKGITYHYLTPAITFKTPV